MADEGKVDLSLVSREDIYKELVKRNDAIVIATFKIMGEKKRILSPFFSGPLLTTLGLSHYLSNHINQYITTGKTSEEMKYEGDI